MPTLNQKNKFNPGEEEYQRNFDFERHERDLQRAKSSGPGNPAERTSTRNGLAEREAAPSWDTNQGNYPEVKYRPSPRQNGSSRLNVAGSLLKKRATKWIVAGIVSLVVSASVAIPAALSGALVNIKEIASDWSNRNNNSYVSKRTSRVLQRKLFQADPNCNSGVRCRYQTGVSDKEIEKMKAAGLNPEVVKDGKKQYIRSFTTSDVDGNRVIVTSDNFQEHYSTNTVFRAHMDTIAKPQSMLMRGKQTLVNLFEKFKINRKDPVGSGGSEKDLEHSLRRTEYGDGNETAKANGAPDPSGNEPNAATDQSQISQVDSSIQEAATAERQALADSGWDRPPSIVPSTSNLDLGPAAAEEVAGGLIKGGLKGALLGVFSAIDKACSGYELIRAVIFGAKVYKVISLIKYAGIILTIADKLKAGDSAAPEIGFLMGILMTPSSVKESLGKTFFQSEGWSLFTQNKIGDHRGLARWTTGTPFLRFFQGAKTFFESAGANKTTCSQVKSWYGQTALIIGGLATDIFSAGTLSLVGLAAGAAIGMTIAVLTAYVTPLLIQYAAGTPAPDKTDAEGGYGWGNAFGAAMGAMGGVVGKSNGGRVLTTADAAAVRMESAKETAFMNAANNYGKSPFSLDSPTSITSQMALAVAPYASAPFSSSTFQSIASILASPFNLFSSALGNVLTKGASAQSDADADGKFCADDDYRTMGIAVDAYCNPITGEKAATIADTKYDPQAVLDYMINNGHIDQDGNPQSGDYKKYIASCVDSITPISPDGGGAELGQDIDTRWCFDTREEFNMFRFYIADSAIDSAHDDSVSGTLGIDDGSAAASNAQSSLTNTTYPNGKLPDSALCALGSSWPNQRIRCDAVDDFAKLADAYQKQFNTPISVADSYRSYDQQTQCRQQNGDVCATPGTSNHGCGQALDFGGGIENFSSAQHKWMLQNAPTYGWINPPWAQQNGTKPEPWHWEYGTAGNSNNGTCQI